MRAARSGPTALVAALRPHQWVKNLLLFVPLVLAHQLTDVDRWIATAWGFVAFCLAASAAYVGNDLRDLEHDRLHPRKQNRPFAAGALDPRTGLILIPLLALSSLTIALTALPPAFTAVLFGYVVVTTAYSVYLKRIVLVDVLVLAGLYAARLFAGGIAAEVSLSPWLLGFSIFLFFSLALAKRYAGLRLAAANGDKGIGGRDYAIGDLPFVGNVGPASGCVAALVLALYISGSDVTELYARPYVLWLAVPLFLYWITRVWLLAHRGELDDDPVVFALRDRTSYVIGFFVALLAVVAGT